MVQPDAVSNADFTGLTNPVGRESDLSDWKTGDCKQLAVYAENEIDWPE
jgi:hypothetical protein